MVSEWAFRTILEIIYVCDYNIPQPPPVSRNDLRDCIDPKMYSILHRLTTDELSELYHAAHFLTLKNLRLNIAGVFAAMVFIGPSFKDFEERKAVLRVKSEFTHEYSVAINANDNECLAIK